MERCQHHLQAIGAEPCHGCKAPSCSSCLVTLRGERLCLKCRNRRLIALQLVESADLKLLRRIRDDSMLTAAGGLPLAVLITFTGALTWSVAIAVLAIVALQICVVTQFTLWLVEWNQP